MKQVENTSSHKINIAVFAHNESGSIIKCLRSIVNATKNPERLNVTVLANGCTDNTVEIVSKFSSEHPNVNCIDIKLGDKSNAWNHYVYGDIDANANHYFMDGDNWLPALALDVIDEAWDYENHWGVAPLGIGHREASREWALENKVIIGNLYGVSSLFIKAVREHEFKLPVGFIGDDSVVGYVLECGFGGDSKPQPLQMIEFTGPIIPRASISLDSLKMLHTRHKRYAMRHFQQEVFYYLARNNRINELPADARDIKPFMSAIGKRPYVGFFGIQTLYHPYALSKILCRDAACGSHR